MIDTSKHAQLQPTIVYDEHDREIARFSAADINDELPHDIPKHVIHAILAAEDHMFFSHHGISFKGIIRAILANLYHGRRAQGASTITQQLVKLTYFHGEKSFSRKIQEQLLALLIERQESKEQILHAYLRRIYCGSGIYGAHTASRCFWNKCITHVSIDEAASIAAIIRCPGRYTPALHPEAHRTRRDLILHRMYTLGYISYGTYIDAVARPVTLSPPEQTEQHTPLKAYLRSQLRPILGKYGLYYGGYTVKTTLNLQMQRQAEETFCQHISAYRHNVDELDGGLITIHTHTGGIKVMVAGYDPHKTSFNRALQAYRQMGSIFKPYVYAAACENGISLSDTACDEPININGWRPRNTHRKHEGTMTYARGLICSNNIMTVKLFLRTGADNVLSCARRCHLPVPDRAYPSLALGCAECSVIQAAAASNVFANEGVYVEPHSIRWIKDQHGHKIWSYTPYYERALSWSVTSCMSSVLSLIMQHMQRHFASEPLEESAIGKTGTADQFRTCWFVGSSPMYTTAVYIGRDDNTPLKPHISSSRHAFPLWLACHRQWQLPYLQRKQFYIDPSLTPVWRHAWNGASVTSDHPHALKLYTHSYDVYQSSQ